MRIKKFLVIALVLCFAILAGCTDKQYPENVVAVVKGQTITTEEIAQELTEREMFIEISKTLYNLEPNFTTPKEALIQSLNITEEELSPEQVRYLESVERSTTKLINYNEAFNILLREAVLYQEAVKNRYEASIDDAKLILDESNKVSNDALLGDEEALRKQNEIMKSANEIYKKYGFESEEDYLNQRIDKTAQAMTINRMKNRFNKVITDKLPLTDSYQIRVDISNAWDDYGEFLLDRVKVKIINPEYSVELYGKPWNYGALDLKSE